MTSSVHFSKYRLFNETKVTLEGYNFSCKDRCYESSFSTIGRYFAIGRYLNYDGRLQKMFTVLDVAGEYFQCSRRTSSSLAKELFYEKDVLKIDVSSQQV